ncbi:hypothetical protein [Streptomyces parvulus]|uniref:hypothetical protein n=1 Tax=Streptomyces parvulus TaxID=146923 RepID=UPI003404538A
MNADFFQPGRTYAYDSTGFTAPELITLFRVAADTVHPDTGKRMAFGWLRVGEGQAWTPYAEPADEWPSCWTDVTENYGGEAQAGPSPAFNAAVARRAQLLAEITARGGEWTTRRTHNLYKSLGITGVFRSTVREDLAAVHRAGHLAQHDVPGRRFYTAKGGADRG